MVRNLEKRLLLVTFIFISVLFIEPIITGPALLIENACAPDREFQQDISIPSNELQFLELVFGKGDELELIFTVEVEQELPIDVWFVDSVNYVRLRDGNEFLYLIDGSEQEITKASKVVSVTQHGTYVLVLANYNNDTVDVNLAYDLNTYPEEVEEDSTPLWQEYYVMLPLGIAIGLIAGLLISRLSKRSGMKETKKKPKTPKKKKKSKPKKVEKEGDIEEEINEEGDEEPEEPPKKEKKKRRVKKEDAKPEEKEPLPKFCGHCGKPVTTRFCPFCGKEAGMT
jgi:hypothetical protein